MTMQTLTKMTTAQNAPASLPDQMAGDLGPDIRTWLAEASSLLTPNAGSGPSDQANLALSLAVAEAHKIISEQQERIEALEQLSHTDELTGALNRRGFAIEIDRCIQEAARRQRSGAILFVDLDGFKEVNDTHGHAAGDAVLQAVADFLMDVVRGGDVVGRLGGDEFAVMLAGVDPKKASTRAKQIQTRLEEVTVDWEGIVLPVRASMGAVSFNGGSFAADILDEADKAMYEAKRARKGARAA